MKKHFNLFVILFLSGIFYSINSLGITVNELFNNANKEYHNKDYQQAILDYMAIMDRNYRSPELYFNLGNCYYRTDSIGKAILYYEKAKRLVPSDKDIAFNIQLANLKVIDKIEPVNEFILITWWNNSVRTFSADTWAEWAIILLCLGLGGLLLFFFGNSLELRKIGFFSGIIFTSTALLLFIITFSRMHFDNSNKYGIILSSSARVMSEPDEQSKELFVLHEGVKVKFLSSSYNYKNIELPDGKQGWVEDNSLGDI